MPGMKRSVQREVLLRILRGTKTHPNADWIYNEARKVLPNISLGTVYRNLSMLSERGDILKLHVGNDSDHFDGDIHPHYHLVCRCCGKIMDLDLPYDDDLDRLAANETGGMIEKHALVFYGICRDCAEKEDLPE